MKDLRYPWTVLPCLALRFQAFSEGFRFLSFVPSTLLAKLQSIDFEKSTKLWLNLNNKFLKQQATYMQEFVNERRKASIT